MRLLVCVDFSPRTDRVIAESIVLARATGASLLLLHVARSEPVLTSAGVGPPGGHRVPPANLAELRARLGELAAPLRAEGLEVAAEVSIAAADVADAILAEAGLHAVSYVVVGSRGHAPLHDAILGSVTRGVVRGARVPVIVVPDATR